MVKLTNSDVKYYSKNITMNGTGTGIGNSSTSTSTSTSFITELNKFYY